MTGQNICVETANILDEQIDILQTKESKLLKEKKNLSKQIDAVQCKMDILGSTLQQEVQQLIETICQKVAVIYHEEVNNLNIQHRSFPLDQVFQQESTLEQLEMYLETCLTSHVNIRVNDLLLEILKENREKIVREVFDSFQNIELEEDQGNRQEEMSFCIRTGSHQDFHFDTQFQFSWGIFYWLKERVESLGRMFPNTVGTGMYLETPSNMSQVLAKAMVLVLASHNTMSGMLTGGLVVQCTSYS